MAIRERDVKNLFFILGLALISCVANGAHRLGSGRGLLHDVSIVDATTFGLKAASGSCKANAAALCSAWEKVCKCTTPSKLVIPPGTYDLAPVVFAGPCNNPVTVEVQGTLKATTDPNAYTDKTWIFFQDIDHMTLTGSNTGVFDGQGECFWKESKCRHNNQCKIELPSNIKFSKLTNSLITGFTSLNSPAFHLHVVSCTNFTASGLTVTAPGDSPNTDGMHISTSCNVMVTQTKIGTGDDCISIGQGNTDVTVSNVECGPGHGISVGSLGKYDDENDVNTVLVTDCKLSNTTNGARIKTWRGSTDLKATNITFQNIVMDMVQNPIIIDQAYGAQKPEPSHVQLSDIHFRNIRGTTTTEEVVNLSCSDKCPCKAVELIDIDFSYLGHQQVNSTCVNAQVNFAGKQNPAPCVV